MARPTTTVRVFRSLGSEWNLPLLEGQTADVRTDVAERLIAARLAEPVAAQRPAPVEPALEPAVEPTAIEAVPPETVAAFTTDKPTRRRK